MAQPAARLECKEVSELKERLLERLIAWNVEVERSFQTETSMIAVGKRGDQKVIVKVVERKWDEWSAGAMLEAFGGRAMVRVYDHIGGAVLLERLDPGSPLIAVVLEGRDEEATEIIAGVIQQMSPGAEPPGTPNVRNLAEGFHRYRAMRDLQIPDDLLDDAERIYRGLCATQRNPRLLHGDLQHSNVLFDSNRGWVAIDPKGIVGEVEYEIGASLRNPVDLPDLLSAPQVIQRRIRQYESALGLDASRMLRWAFAQAVLSAVWSVEDGYAIMPDSASIRLAQAIRPMLGS